MTNTITHTESRKIISSLGLIKYLNWLLLFKKSGERRRRVEEGWRSKQDIISMISKSADRFALKLINLKVINCHLSFCFTWLLQVPKTTNWDEDWFK